MEEQKESSNLKLFELNKKQLQSLGLSQQEVNRILGDMGFKNLLKEENSQNKYQHKPNLMQSIINQKFAQASGSSVNKFENNLIQKFYDKCANCSKISSLLCECQAYQYCSENCKRLFLALRHRDECSNLMLQKNKNLLIQEDQNSRGRGSYRGSINYGRGGRGGKVNIDSDNDQESNEQNSFRGRGGDRGGRGGRGGDRGGRGGRGGGIGVRVDADDSNQEENASNQSFRGRGGGNRGDYQRGQFRGSNNNRGGRGSLNSSFLNSSQSSISVQEEEKKSKNDANSEKRKFFDTKREIELYNELMNQNNFEQFVLMQEKKVFENIISIFNSAEMDFKTVGGTQGIFQQLLALLHKLLQNDQYDEEVSDIIQRIMAKDFFSKDTFTKYVKLIQFKNKYDFKNIESLQELIDALLYWCQVNDKIILILPSKSQILAAQEIQQYVEQLQLNILKFTSIIADQNAKKLKQDYSQLVNHSNLIVRKISLKSPYSVDMNLMKKQNANKKVLKQIMVENQIVILPNDFRDLTINPSLDELNSQLAPFLHPIKKIGQFESMDHYLDANFRLLKEDFSKELRDGLIQLKENNTKNLKLLINFYQSAQVSGFFVSNNFFGLSLKIDCRKNGQSWEQSSKFMFGQLIIFSDDNFEKNLYSGIIRHRDGKEMDKQQKQFGFITIQIEILVDENKNQLNAFQIFQKIEGRPLTIIESKTYFEAYYHVLKCLQQTKNFPTPFEEMIVKVNHQRNLMPQIWNEPNMQITLQQYVRDKGLDQHQGRAFLHAFRNTLSLIQGPPGTGKTFVGEKIVDFMIKNIQRDKAKRLSTGPLFLVCFTNHALDQFLEKNMESTSKVIRLGARTKIEEFKKLNINSVRHSIKQRLPQEFYDLRDDLRSLQRNFENLNKKFFQICNIPLISLDLINDHEQILIKKLKQIQTFFQTDLNVKKIMDIIKKWLNQIKLQFNTEFKDRRVSYQQTEKIEIFLKKNNLINADTMSWLKILDVNLLIEKSLEKEEIDEQNQEEEEYDDASQLLNKFDQYQEKDIDIQNFIKQTEQVYKFLKNEPLCGGNYNNYASLLNTYKTNFTVNQQIQSQFNIYIATLVNARQPDDPFALSDRNKWLLNFGLIDIIRQDYQQNIEALCLEIKQKNEDMEKIRIKYDVLLMQQMDIIAMTTTGAAKYKNVLRGVNSKIMIVEEAAEILESHLFTSINNNIEQLVLIGDHQQLRPSLNVLELSQNYNLDLSMFERLIDNGFQFSKLITQRRMRPEISEVMRQIYPDLLDHPTVQNRQNIRGVNNKNYFFFNHQFPEEEIQNMATKKNPMEALFIIKFCEYLLKQNYTASQITILTLYAGQLLTVKGIQRTKPKESEVKRIRICNVDDYQGEENDIIVMSLVRSNDRDQIGFLRASNRICVALSRARNGLFIFGNANCLKNAAMKLQEQEQKQLNRNNQKAVAQEHLWIKVLKILSNRNDIDDQLVLKCQNHSNETIIKHPDDFDKCPEGGCKEKCKTRMDCGHSCESFCHSYVTSKDDITGHDNVKCMKMCERKRTCGHKCNQFCSRCKNGKIDGHLDVCYEEIKVKLNCNHENKFRCFETTKNDGNQLECKHLCEKILQCGHKCKKLCMQNCTKMYDSDIKKGYLTNCKEKVIKKLICGCKVEVDCGFPAEKFFEKEGCSTKKIFKLECGHEYEGKCSSKKEDLNCNQQCNKILECGHPCPNKCSQCIGKMFHGECKSKCGRINVCNHECQDIKCNSNCPPCIQNCKIKCSHSKCPQKCGEPCKQCIEPCKYSCEHSRCRNKCFEICSRRPCKKSCKIMLKCGHPCIGFCGEKCPDSCRDQFCQNYDQETFEIFFGDEQDDDVQFVELEDCGHAFEAKALDQYIIFQCKDNQIKYPECPKCKTLIQNCPRIQNILKEITRKVDKIKNKILQDNNNFLINNLKFQRIEEVKKLLQNQKEFMNYHNMNFQWIELVINNSFQLQKKQAFTSSQVITAVTSLNFCELFLKTIEMANLTQSSSQFMLQQYKQISEVFDQFASVNIHSERLKKIGRIFEAFDLAVQIKYNLDSKDNKSFQVLIESLNLIIGSKYVLEEKEQQKIKENLKDILKDNPLHKKMIIEAIGLSSGHWYECRNGHPYVIGECGGAMQKSVCPECKEEIGGQNHSLNQFNRVSQFAGARKPAFDPNDYDAHLQAALEIQRQLNQNQL